jgi:hypothetical protein
MKKLGFEIFKLEPVSLYYFKLHDVAFLFDEFYKEKVLSQASEIPDANAEAFLFRETSIMKLNENTYYLKLSLFYDTVIIKRKRKPDPNSRKIDIDSWYNIVRKKGEEIINIPFKNIMSVYDEGLIMFEFDRYKEDLFILETRLHNISKLIPLY